MPYYAEKETTSGEKLSRSERRRLARQRALVEKEEEQYLSTGGRSILREWLLYPFTGLITACSPLWLHYNLEELPLKDAQTYLIPLTIAVCFVLNTIYKEYENFFRPQLARLREPAIAIELSRLEKWSSRKTRLDRLHILKQQEAGTEAAFYSVFIINALFLAHVTLAYCFCIRSLPANYSYVISLIIAVLATMLLTNYLKIKKSS